MKKIEATLVLGETQIPVQLDRDNITRVVTGYKIDEPLVIEGIEGGEGIPGTDNHMFLSSLETAKLHFSANDGETCTDSNDEVTFNQKLDADSSCTEDITDSHSKHDTAIDTEYLSELGNNTGDSGLNAKCIDGNQRKITILHLSGKLISDARLAISTN